MLVFCQKVKSMVGNCNILQLLSLDHMVENNCYPATKEIKG
jgi:hypothetical protein